MLVSETSAAALPLTCIRGLARVPEKRARVPSVAHPWPNMSLKLKKKRQQSGRG